MTSGLELGGVAGHLNSLSVDQRGVGPRGSVYAPNGGSVVRKCQVGYSSWLFSCSLKPLDPIRHWNHHVMVPGCGQGSVMAFDRLHASMRT